MKMDDDDGCWVCRAPRKFGNYCSIIHFVEGTQKIDYLFPTKCHLVGIEIATEARLNIDITPITKDLILKRACPRLISLSMLYNEKYRFFEDIKLMKEFQIWNNGIDGPYMIQLYDGAPQIQLTSKVLKRAFELLQNPYAKLINPLDETEFDHDIVQYIDMIEYATKTRDIRNIAKKKDDDKWRYRSGDFLFCHLLIDERLRITCAALLTEYMLLANTPMQIVDIQPYVLKKLSKLGRVERSATGKKWQADVNIILPHSQDNDIWSILVGNYESDNDNKTYDIEHITDDRYVSIIATDENMRLLGYITCTLHHAEGLYKTEMKNEMDYNSQLVQAHEDASADNLFNVFSINGTHVNASRRGGNEKSLAMLLRFHALYFAKEAAAELGIRMITSYAYARTTMVSLKQFGFSHLNPGKELEWMKERVKPIREMREKFRQGFNVLNMTKQLLRHYIDTPPVGDDYDSDNDSRSYDADDDENWELIFELKRLYREDEKYPKDEEETSEAIEKMVKELNEIKKNLDGLIEKKPLEMDLRFFTKEFGHLLFILETDEESAYRICQKNMMQTRTVIKRI